MAILLSLVALGAPRAGSADAPYSLGPSAAENPQRVITLAPSITEIVIDLGRADALVGVSRHDDASEVQSLPRVGGFLDPSPEAILALRPELLLVQPSPGNRKIVERLAALGVPVLVLPLHTIEETLASIRAVGSALGAGEQGESLAAGITAGLSEIRVAAASRPSPRALIVYGWRPLVVAGAGSFGHELLEAAGAQNVAAGLAGPYPTLSAEAALAAAPDVVIDASGGHGEAGGPLNTWKEKIKTPDSDALFRPGPRLLEGMKMLLGLLNSGSTAPSPPSRETDAAPPVQEERSGPSTVGEAGPPPSLPLQRGAGG